MNTMAYSEPDPLSGNWSYDSAIDLFALNPVFPDPFQMDLADELLPMDPKEFSERPVQQSVTGYTMSHHPNNEVASLPSDVESDDQSWSPTHLSSLDNFAMDIAAKRAAHNIIEKRYRTNMNAKFVALEKAMAGAVGTSMSASATAASRSTRGGSSASLKKSEILSNAIAYMQELQEANQAMRKEMTLLRQSMGLGRRY
ncbi:hypothetical protein P168DRAFT_128580 [Aspergillus campestris IBT 28561]|uniref:BHLH domain-containing protein n=1 Tax=Aspergillus campestris (strain IBT 28561) TaxID=1392248 RepID=A0A2I1D745_ASPC2|nr:uncharacterized protein P168DRAFT_128580 [Aspergillus campestris IBT 28561]PKY05687.1 hypothetical protein P168DRAFT_128580 [Aspergillus campestris IBT 28561]